MQGFFRGLAAVAALAVSFPAAARELDADGFARVLASLQSNAQEARLFMQALQDAKLTGAYARVHGEELSSQVRDCAKPLEGTAPAPLTAKARRARTLAGKLADALEKLDAAGIDAAQRDLQNLAHGT